MLEKIDLPGLDKLDENARRLVSSRGQLAQLSAGTVVFRGGDPCQSYLWVVSGSVRIQLTAENGREIVLYRVTRGESCVLTTSCLFRQEAYSAEGICETDVTAIAIPAATFRDLLASSETFRDLVLGDYARRVGDILMLIDMSASHHVGNRLARIILERGASGSITATHYDLAVELGTAREVVSRILKEWERQGLIELSRGRLKLLDRAGLKNAMPM